MTQHHDPKIAGDYRRAAGLVAHYGTNNLEGINAILQDAVENNRATELILALLGVYDALVPELRTEFGIKIMSAEILRMAGLEADQ